MKPIFFFALVAMVGCKSKTTVKPAPYKTEPAKAVAVNLPAEVNSSLELLDSTIDVLVKNRNAENKRDQYAILYYKTGEERYRLLSNKYNDSVGYWYQKAQKIKAKIK